MRFRPCIDLRNGKVVQIVGATLAAGVEPTTNFTANETAERFARRYREDGLAGGHVIALGAGNDDSALAALRAFPGGLQMGGFSGCGHGGKSWRCFLLNAALWRQKFCFEDRNNVLTCDKFGVDWKWLSSAVAHLVLRRMVRGLAQGPFQKE